MENAMVPRQREEHIGLPVEWECNPFARGFTLFASFNMSDDKGRKLAFKCSQKADFGTDDCLGEVFAVQDVLCHRVQLAAKDDGEVTHAIRTVLIDTNGATYAFVSKGVFDSLTWMGHLWGPPPWVGGKNIKPVQTTKGKKRLLLLEPADEEYR